MVNFGLSLRRVPTWVIYWAGFGVGSVWVVGQSYRDSTWLTSLAFYLPSPCVCLFLILCGGTLHVRRRRRLAIVLGSLAVIPALWVCGVENRFGHSGVDVVPEETSTLMHWNIRGRRINGDAWSRVLDHAREKAPDLCVMSEVPAFGTVAQLETAFGDEFEGRRFHNMSVVARGSLHGGEWLSRWNGVDAYGLIWESEQGPCRVMVVDLSSTLRLPRDPRLRKICALMESWRADIVVGDFNAPRRSKALSELPSGFVHAYDVAGEGWSYTWPVPCPVYAIDQCIVGRRVRAFDYQLETTWKSDHRLQLLQFSLQN